MSDGDKCTTLNIKIVNIQIASSYAKDIANYLLK